MVNKSYGPQWYLVRALALQRDANRCQYCGRGGRTGDHVVPHSKGGVSQLDNVVCACSRCNTSKGARTLVEWVRSGTAPARAAKLLEERTALKLPV